MRAPVVFSERRSEAMERCGDGSKPESRPKGGVAAAKYDRKARRGPRVRSTERAAPWNDSQMMRDFRGGGRF